MTNTVYCNAPILFAIKQNTLISRLRAYEIKIWDNESDWPFHWFLYDAGFPFCVTHIIYINVPHMISMLLDVESSER